MPGKGMSGHPGTLPPLGLETLSSFARDLSGTLDPRLLMEGLADSLRRNLGAFAGCIQVSQAGWSEAGLPPCHVFPEEAREALLETCRSRSGVATDDRPRLFPPSKGIPRPPGRTGEGRLLDLPLLYKGSRVGLITLWLPTELADSLPLHPDLPTGERDLLSLLGDEIALRVINVMLHCRAENLVQERELRLRELWILQETNNALRGTVKLNRILKMILAGATTELGLGFNRAALFLLNEKTGYLQGMLGVGPDSSEEAARIWASLAREGNLGLSRQIEIYAENQPASSRFDTLVKGIRISVGAGRGSLAHCISTRSAIRVNGHPHDHPPERELGEKLSMTLFAATPIVARDQVFGIMAVDNIFDHKPITDENLRLLTMFANQAGLAIAGAKAHRAHQRAAEELRAARDQLVQSERLAALGEIAANLAHEIRNPLVTIGGFARRLEKKFNGSDTGGRYAGIIASEVHRLEQFLDQVLHFGQDRKPVFGAVHPEALIEDTLGLFSWQFEEAGIKVRRSLPPDLPSLEADANQLRQVFINLFSNAAEAMAEGGVLTLSGGLEPGPPALLRIAVSDSGGGMEPDALGNIFSPFFTTKRGGHGLGLSLSQRIIDAHGGRITVENFPGRGLTFQLYLPLPPPEEAVRTGPSKKEEDEETT
jgi:two-component system sensor histidine kinase HydH